MLPSYLLQRVHDRRVCLHAQPELHPVAIDGSDERPLVGPARLLFNERGEGHHLPDGETLLRRAASKLLGEARAEAAHHRRHETRRGCGARERIRLGKQVALEVRGCRVEIAHEGAIGRRLQEVARLPELP